MTTVKVSLRMLQNSRFKPGKQNFPVGRGHPRTPSLLEMGGPYPVITPPPFRWFNYAYKHNITLIFKYEDRQIDPERSQ
jgi:hypothetical protein